MLTTGAGLTQLVECQLPKLDVAGSNPVSRSILVSTPCLKVPPFPPFHFDSSGPIRT